MLNERQRWRSSISKLMDKAFANMARNRSRGRQARPYSYHNALSMSRRSTDTSHQPNFPRNMDQTQQDLNRTLGHNSSSGRIGMNGNYVMDLVDLSDDNDSEKVDSDWDHDGIETTTESIWGSTGYRRLEQSYRHRTSNSPEGASIAGTARRSRQVRVARRAARNKSREGDVAGEEQPREQRSARRSRAARRAAIRRSIIESDDEVEMDDNDDEDSDYANRLHDGEDDDDDDDDQEGIYAHQDDSDDGSSNASRAVRARERIKRRPTISAREDDQGLDNTTSKSKGAGRLNRKKLHGGKKQKVDTSTVEADNQDSSEIQRQPPVYTLPRGKWGGQKGRRSVPMGVVVDREWLTQLEQADHLYCPQVGDLVYYFPEGHSELLCTFPEDTKPPWNSFPQKWGVVQCRVIEINFDFPSRKEYEYCPSALATLTLVVVKTPSAKSNQGSATLPFKMDFIEPRATRHSQPVELTFQVILLFVQ